MRAFRTAIFVLLLGSVFLYGCSERKPDRLEQRFVSLVPSVTEILFALGAGDKVAAVTRHCDYPEQARMKPRVGDFSNPSIERIVAMKPDVVFATAPEQRGIVEKLEKLGITAVMISPESVEEVFETIRTIGKMTRTEERAAELVDEMVTQKRKLEEKVKNRERKPRVYVELDVNPLFTVGRGSFVNELIELAGGVNIVEASTPYLPINPEGVVAKDPQVIILAYPGEREEVAARVGWGAVSAIRDGRVYDDIDPNLIARPGPRCIEGATELFRRLYPEVE